MKLAISMLASIKLWSFWDIKQKSLVSALQNYVLALLLHLFLLKSKETSTGSIYASVIQDKSLFKSQMKGAELANFK